MDPVSNADRMLMVLRQRLQERARAASKGGAAGSGKAHRASTGLGNARALAALDGVDDRQMRRTLVQGILADQFGAAAVNDARFQQIVDQVAATLEGDADGARLLARILAELRPASRQG